LLSLIKTPGWEAVLDLMEEECIKAETEHFQTKPEETNKILTGHWTARAMRLFFERIQKAVLYETNEAISPEEQEPLSPESVEYITGVLRHEVEY
jgi:hypothetical protein